MTLTELKCRLQYLLPHHLLSRLVAKLADCKIPVIKNFLITSFINLYKVDLNIAESSKLSDYASFNEFFTRSLKPDARPINSEINGIISPADGSVSQWGKISQGKLIQAKGQEFSLQNLLGGNAGLGDKYAEGDFVTIYLAPKDYHRVHMPISGKLKETRYIPGKLFSVNMSSVQHVSELFCHNERLVCLFDTAAGEMALILVGAMLVAGIETVWGQRETPCSSNQIIIKNYESQEIILEKGQEMGRFQYGSTVILLFQPSKMRLSSLEGRSEIKMGELIGKVFPQ